MFYAAGEIDGAFLRLEHLRRDEMDRPRNTAGPSQRKRLTRGELEPVLDKVGITRVGDLTDLDDIGVPVWAAIRPGSRSLSVSAGRGTTDEAAWTSAVMESCEQAMAERVGDLVDIVDTARGMARRGLRVIALDRQSRCAASHLDPDRELAWVKGMSWRTGETVHAPYELVGMDMLAEAPWDIDIFRMSSLGLASGADLTGAIIHGLHELVEDDALFAALLPRAGATAKTVIFRTERGAVLEELVQRLAKAGVEARFVEIGADAKLPVVAAGITPDRGLTDDMPFFCGVSCNATREEAALGALLEAIQCRAIFISGARDDLWEEDYRMRLTEATRSLFCPAGFGRTSGAESVAASLAATAEAVMGMTGGDFYVFPLGGASCGFETVRVLADDLVSMYAPSGHARTGRAAAKLLSQWARP